MRWLHISDIHYNPANDGRNSRKLRENLIEYLSSKQIVVDEIFITGDFRHARDQKNMNQDYVAKEAVDFIKKIAYVVGIKEQQHIYIVPGNHDLDRGERNILEDIQKKYDAHSGVFTNDVEKLISKFEFFKKINKILYDNESVWNENLRPMHAYKCCDTYSILLINTVMTCWTGDDRGKLIIGTDELDKIIRKIKSINPNKPIIALGHHSMTMFRQDELATVEKIFKDYDIRIYLCGDAHRIWYRHINSVLEITMGCMKYEQDIKAVFSVGELKNGIIEAFKAYSWDSDFERWSEYSHFNEGFEKEVLNGKSGLIKVKNNNAGLPMFNKRGTLDRGIHKCSSEEFIQRFCGDSEIRQQYKVVLEQLFAFAVHRGASSIIVGGSFITDKKEPNDIDCVVVYPNVKFFEVQSDELLILDNCELDIMYVTEQDKELLHSLIALYSADKYDMAVGVVEIILSYEVDHSTWEDYTEFSNVESLMLARRAYINRNLLRGAKEKRVLVTIGNEKEFTKWNLQVTPEVSASGWIFAPYVYKQKDKQCVEKFFSWLYQVFFTYDAEVSFFADGIGTYILAKFLELKFSDNFTIDKIILSRSLVTPEFEWAAKSSANLVVNIIDKEKRCLISEKYNDDIKRDSIFKVGYESEIIPSNNHFHNIINLPDIYDCKSGISSEKFINTILSIVNISSMLRKNQDDFLQSNMAEFGEKIFKFTNTDF